MTKTLLSLGHGFSAKALTSRLIREGWTVFGTTRSEAKIPALEANGVTPLLWEKGLILQALAQADHVLISAGPNDMSDPTLQLIGSDLAHAARRLSWVGYLSTTGVYGDHGGDWVDEDTPITPSTKRGKARAAAEAAWLSIPDLPVHVFRLAGIYGPGRGPFEKIRNGTAQRVIKPGQVFSRIHVEDIATVLQASIAQPNPGQIYNVCDTDPAPPQDVLTYAAKLLGLPPPPEVDFETANMRPMARSFYADSKKVRNTRILEELGVQLAYPNYHDGLRKVLKDEDGV